MDETVPLSVEDRIAFMVHKLPTLDKAQIPHEDSCPICLVSFNTILEGTSQDTEDVVRIGEREVKLRGITKLEGCGHLFCRLDLIEWIRGRHGTCPTCRNPFLDITPASDSDNESSDGDYIPNDDEDDEDEDAFFDTDGFTDVEDFDMDMEADLESWGDMEPDIDGDYYESEDDFHVDVDIDIAVNLGLSDGEGESLSLSEAEIATSGEDDSTLVDATVYSASGDSHPGGSQSQGAESK